MEFKDKNAEAVYWWAQVIKPDAGGVLPPREKIINAGQALEKLALEMEAERAKS